MKLLIAIQISPENISTLVSEVKHVLLPLSEISRLSCYKNDKNPSSRARYKESREFQSTRIVYKSRIYAKDKWKEETNNLKKEGIRKT